jgi:HK97 gp10 family phage protein
MEEQLTNIINQIRDKFDLAVEKAVKYSAEKILSDLREIFKTEGRSHNVEWTDLKESYLKWKIKKGFSEKKLHKTTTLKQSFTYQTDKYKAKVGTPVPYAVFHEYGTKKMTARPFMQPVFDRFIERDLRKIFQKTFREIRS